MTEADRTRAAALASLDVLDTPAEAAFDDFVAIAAEACATPIALVSLLDGDRQWFKARVGLDVCETPIDQSVCRLEIEAEDFLEIADLTADPRTHDNPLVTGPRSLRFYAGAPLRTSDGTPVGRLCVIDTAARPAGLTGGQRDILGALARRIGDQFDLRRQAFASRRLAALQTALIDIGERIRRATGIAEMTAAAAAIVGDVLGVDRAGFGLVDDATEVVDIQPDWTAPGIGSIAGRHRFENFGRLRAPLAAGEPLVIHDVVTDPRTRDHVAAMQELAIGALVNMPVRDGGRTTAVFIAQSIGPRWWSDDELAFLRSVADRLEAGVVRLRLEQQQQTLNGEISHRLKNTLAMVQAIASQTLRTVVERAPIDSFERRLTALSTAHDVLLQRSWTEADLGSIVRGSVEGAGFDDRVSCAGPPVKLGSRAALSASLLMHELTTNAAKYGALSSTDGRVVVEWMVDGAGEGGDLTLRWRETGGPPAVAPSRRGFGSKLIRLGLVGTGGVDLRYLPSGLEAEFRAPINELADA